MQFGDLSNEVASRIILVFEGLLGHLPAGKVADYEKYSEEGRWDSVISQFQLNDMVLNRVLYLTWKSNFNIHVVTWFPEEAAVVISDKLDALSIPVRSVFSSTPAKLAKMLVYSPDITCVYDPVPEHVLTFGSKGFVITDPNQIGT